LEPFIIGRVEGFSNSGDGMRIDVVDGEVGPGDEVVFTRRELQESDVWVGESEKIDSGFSIKVGSTPKSDTDSVTGCEVGTERRPAEVKLTPFGVSDGLVSVTSDDLEGAVSAAPVEAGVGIGEC
jgi:hypothetical protein